MRPIRFLVVHTSATADKRGNPVDADVDSMRAYHIEHNGWDDVGYHFVVRMDGSIEYGRKLDTPGAHVGGFNADTVGICCSGHGDLAPFTAEQHKTLAELCAKLCREHGLSSSRVIGHREADDFGAPKVDKTCPGTKVDLDVIRAEVQLELDRRRTPPMPSTPLDSRVEALERRMVELERLLLMPLPPGARL